MYPVRSVIPDLQREVAAKVALNIQVPLLNVAARRVLLNVAVAEIRSVC